VRDLAQVLRRLAQGYLGPASDEGKRTPAVRQKTTFGPEWGGPPGPQPTPRSAVHGIWNFGERIEGVSVASAGWATGGSPADQGSAPPPGSRNQGVWRGSSRQVSCSAARRGQEERMEAKDVRLRIALRVRLMRQFGAGILTCDHIPDGI